jgi:hypothetical protein
MNSDEGRAARRLFRSASNFEDFVNLVLFRAGIDKRVFIPRNHDDYWSIVRDSQLRKVQTEMQAVLRVAASLVVQRSELRPYSFYIAACLETMKAPGIRSTAMDNYHYINSTDEWKKMKEGSLDYFDTALAGYRGINLHILAYINKMAALRFPADYLHDAADDSEHGVFTMLYSISQLEHLQREGIPAAYARDLRLAERTFSLSSQSVVDIYRAGVPIEYVTGCIKQHIYPYRILDVWREGIPIEYAAFV